jgi:hypothetical protein
MGRNTTFVGRYETKNEWNTMSMINKTADLYNTIYFKNIECMLQYSTVYK